MPRFTTGPIENTGNQPGNASFVRVKILNHSQTTLTGQVRAFRLNGTKKLNKAENFSVPPASSTFVDLTLNTFGPSFQYEVVIQEDQLGGVFSSYGFTNGFQLIPAQRVLNSELTEL